MDPKHWEIYNFSGDYGWNKYSFGDEQAEPGAGWAVSLPPVRIHVIQHNQKKFDLTRKCDFYDVLYATSYCYKRDSLQGLYSHKKWTILEGLFWFKKLKKTKLHSSLDFPFNKTVFWEMLMRQFLFPVHGKRMQIH